MIKKALAWTLGVLFFVTAVAVVSSGPPALTSDLFIDQPAELTPSATPNDRRDEIADPEEHDIVFLGAYRLDPVTFSVYDATIFHGKTTASGEVYDHYRAEEPYTCASNDYPIGTWLYCSVTVAKKVGPKGAVALTRSAVCRVNDRMHDRFSGERIDLSGGAFAALSPTYDFTDESSGLLGGDVAVLTDEEVRRLIGDEKWEAFRGR